MTLRGRLLRGRWRHAHDVDEVPPEAGTVPIPAGTVRLYHYTHSIPALHAIAREGIRTDLAGGHTYGEPNMVWASAEVPNRESAYVEFWARPEEIDVGSMAFRDPRHATQAEIRALEEAKSNVTLYGDLAPDRIVAVHEPWHHTYRYIDAEPQSIASMNEYPSFRVTGDPQTDKGIAMWFKHHPDRDRPNPENVR